MIGKRIFNAIAAILLCGAAGASFAADKPSEGSASTARKKGGKFVKLYNGKNLDGWTVKCRPKDYDKKGYWKAADGTITTPDKGQVGGVGINNLLKKIDVKGDLARAEAENLRVTLLPEWYDVDTAEDLERLLREVQRYPDDLLKHTRRYFTKLSVDLNADLTGFGSQDE